MAENTLASYPITLGDRLRANAALLVMIAERYGRLGHAGLVSLAETLCDEAGAADAQAEGQAWVELTAEDRDRPLRLRGAAA